MRLSRFWHLAGLLVLIVILLNLWAELPAVAGTTGTITGTASEADTGTPIAGVKVTATSGSGTASTQTNRVGFYSLQALIPDSYTLTFKADGYDVAETAGVTVNQDQITIVDRTLRKTVQTLGVVHTVAQSNLVQPKTGTDVYNITGNHLAAASGGDSLQKTLYQYTATVPGLAPIGGGFPAEPSIRGGQDTDNGYEFDGIPITERILGFYTTNLSNTGISNLEVYTGGLTAGAAANGTGVINSVVKVGRYPEFGLVSFGFTSPYFNHFLGLEYGGASPNGRFSYYAAFNGENSENGYNYGEASYPNLVYSGSGVSITNAGPVAARDVVANFHYKTDPNDDYQFMYENSLFDQSNNYLLFSATPGAPLLQMRPCQGAIADPSDSFGSFGQGGVAPNGKPCPAGLWEQALPNGGGVVTAHYGALGKLQWNHIIGDHSSFSVRLAENFNQYIFAQTLTDPNNPGYETPVGGCPPLPYPANSPAISVGGSLCTHDSGDYYQDRNSRMYIAAFDYTTTPSANLTLKAGLGQEYDQNYRGVFNLASFNPNTGGWPGMAFYGSLSDIPTHIPYVYLQATINTRHFTFEPGVRYQREWYGLPSIPNTQFANNHSISVGVWVPTFAGTYRINDDNVVRYSWGQTASFIGTAYVWRISSNNVMPTFYNPLQPGAAVAPQVNHAVDLMWEHQFNPLTSLRIGPWYRSTNNYFEEFNPFLGFDAVGNPIFSKEDVGTNGLKIRALGVELGVNHNDPRPTGASLWLSGSYDNYWTSATAGNSGYYNLPLPTNLVNQGVYVRNTFVPLFAGTFLTDLHSNGFHVQPLLYYSFDSYYNIATLQNCPLDPITFNPVVGCTSNATQISQPEGKGAGYFVLDATIRKDFGVGQDYSVGIRGTNLTNNLQGTTPCQVDPAGTGCSPYNGPYSGVTTAQSPAGCYGFGDFYHPACNFINQKVSQNARLYEFFFVRHF
jgi:hypothetical protein